MWNNIIAQDRAKKILINIFKTGNIAHSYIFFGKDGTGKDAAAIEFAKLLNCSNPVDNNPCDICKSCIQISTFKSPFVRFITALPAGKDSEDNDTLSDLKPEDYDLLNDELAKKSQDIYHKIKLPKANTIRISSIRDIKNSIYLSENSGVKKVYIISDADLMNVFTANSLLKILEEPPKNSVIILTTSRINSLLPTIVGRCQKIHFEDIPVLELKKYILKKSPSLSESETLLMAELSNGSIYICNKILNENYAELREKVIEFLTSMLTNKNLLLGSTIDDLISGKDKEKIKQFLVLLIYWFRDLFLLKYNYESNIINSDKIDRLKNFNKNFKSDNMKIIGLIEDSFRDFDQNLNPELILFHLSQNIKLNIHRNSGI
ncbi:MAG TPA: DNA polymerase III subunit delta' C-terminal domain-containing protein [Ignavibacteria bacterium]|nr:DNA polymerase III subunit delta' C-terminal domain-containing protein [Ignavibacteria bacterium]